MELRPIVQGDDLRKDWRRINELVEEVKRLRGEVERLGKGLADERAKKRYHGGGGGEECPYG